MIVLMMQNCLNIPVEVTFKAFFLFVCFVDYNKLKDQIGESDCSVLLSFESWCVCSSGGGEELSGLQ